MSRHQLSWEWPGCPEDFTIIAPFCWYNSFFMQDVCCSEVISDSSRWDKTAWDPPPSSEVTVQISQSSAGSCQGVSSYICIFCITTKYTNVMVHICTHILSVHTTSVQTCSANRKKIVTTCKIYRRYRSRRAFLFRAKYERVQKPSSLCDWAEIW